MFIAASGCGNQDAPETATQAPAMAIHTAAALGNIEAVRQHIRAGSDLNARDAYGSTPLIAAITFGRTEVATALIDARADLTIANNDGSTPLHIAAFMCHPEVVTALLEAGADKEALNRWGSTPRQSVEAPFEKVKGMYDAIGEALGPLGLTLDYERIQATRPVIAEMLK